MSNNLDDFRKLTEFDYAFLKADKEVFPHWGAALSICQEWCRNGGYGEWGKPTEAGKRAMARYEEALTEESQ